MKLVRNTGAETLADYVADQTLSVVPGSATENRKRDAMLQAVANLGLSQYLLTDDRTVMASTPVGWARPEDVGSVPDEPPILGRHASDDSESDEEEQKDPTEYWAKMLDNTVRRAETWIRRKALAGSITGDSDANTIYAQVVSELATPVAGRPPQTMTASALIKRIDDIETRNRSFASIGLTNVFRGGTLKRALGNSKKAGTIGRILDPYLSGVEARLKRLSEVQERVGTLLRTINSFYADKEISYHVRRGFRFRLRNGEILRPGELSSGERHLLLMFLNTIIAIDRPCVFMMDEPEISLNVKWQQALVSSLLECARGSQIHFLFATHSFELLARHRERTVRLANG